MALTDRSVVPLRSAQVVAGGMLAVAAVRPMLPVETMPPCPLRILTGVPCPLCGMTRGVTAAVHGNVGRALELNPASVVLVVLAVVLLVMPALTRRLPKLLVAPAWSILLVLGAMWGYQLVKYATGAPL